jgi:hypothetical protein
LKETEIALRAKPRQRILRIKFALFDEKRRDFRRPAGGRAVADQAGDAFHFISNQLKEPTFDAMENAAMKREPSLMCDGQVGEFARLS